ncbi:MAG: D-alanyl-D-alanine carboxypeptidase [Actinomycetota bacterium]|nr:D-alanyl-D-alanine carboxypeptidase [Actinomycetota bacterium]MDH5312877.1 D-alanyl-D-alanine carboxypeptidase [Actinomycetota bacterium]
MRLRRLLVATFTTCAAFVVAAPVVPAVAAPPRWVQRVDFLVDDLPISVAISLGGKPLYRHKDWVARPPASNEKLLLSMALLKRLGGETTIPTRLFGTERVGSDGVLTGDLWIVGHGDPEIAGRDMADLARALVDAGVVRVRGRVFGSTGPFARDWWAPGWRDYFPRYYIALPTALTYRFNQRAGGRHVSDPERLAAKALTKKLEARGIEVTGKAGSGRPPGRLVNLASLRSDALSTIMRRMNLVSSNFRAEVLGKMLGARRLGSPGTIAKGARVIERFADARGVQLVAHDGSGLSYANRVSADGMVDMLRVAERAPWGEMLRATLPAGGEGTLKDRLETVTVRAKTGTLIEVSALSGWVWLEREDAWAAFSILSSGMNTTQAKSIENKIVRVVAANAAPR